MYKQGKEKYQKIQFFPTLKWTRRHETSFSSRVFDPTFLASFDDSFLSPLLGAFRELLTVLLGHVQSTLFRLMRLSDFLSAKTVSKRPNHLLLASSWWCKKLRASWLREEHRSTAETSPNFLLFCHRYDPPGDFINRVSKPPVGIFLGVLGNCSFEDRVKLKILSYSFDLKIY